MRDGRVCIGSLEDESLRNVRLVPEVGHSHSPDAPYHIGDIWDVPVAELSFLRRPHVEDVRLVGGGTRVQHLDDVGAWLRASVKPWRGSAACLFGGSLRRNDTGRACVRADDVPAGSVGFWLPDRPLLRHVFGEKQYYDYTDDEGARWRFSYAGMSPSLSLILANTMVRVSLTRWWTPPDGDGAEACWAQVSGWFPTSGPLDDSTAVTERTPRPLSPASANH